MLVQSEGAYLIEAHTNPGNHLIIPKGHVISPLELPDNWWYDMKQLLAHIPGLAKEYNIAMNLGEHAGQSVKHLHFWVVPRGAGQPASGKGLARLIAEVNDSKPSNTSHAPSR